MASPLDMPKKPKVRVISDEHRYGNWGSLIGGDPWNRGASSEDFQNVPSKTFHGTPVDIKGDRVLPAVVHGGKSHWYDTGISNGQESQRNTFSIPNESEAWEWGSKAVAGVPESRDPGYRNRVYEVTPGTSARHGKEVAGEVVADYHTITGRHDIMPGRQGTFPDLNWNQFKDPDRDIYDEIDANHPSDGAAKYGHAMVDDSWTMKQSTEMTQKYAKGDMDSDLQWDRGDRVTRESRRDRRFGEQTALFPEPKEVDQSRKKEAEIDHLRSLLESPK